MAFWKHLVVKWRGRDSASSLTHITDHVLFVSFMSYFIFSSLQGVITFSASPGLKNVTEQKGKAKQGYQKSKRRQRNSEIYNKMETDETLILIFG